MDIILIPPIGFIIYCFVGYLIFLYGKKTAPIEDYFNEEKTALYGSGEEAPEERGVPGYKPFLLISLFFALLHLGVLVIGTSNLNPSTIFYTVILMAGLVALMFG